MKIAILQFPGTNCERETRLALRRTGFEVCDVYWNQTGNDLSSFDGFVLAGGFSYEDRIRSGTIAALSKMIEQLKQQESYGKPILGICNGAQILVEAGMVPGLKNYKLGAALYDNVIKINNEHRASGYLNDWCIIKPNQITSNAIFTNAFADNEVIRIPYAHAQGRFIVPEDLLNEMNDNHHQAFHYCDALGHKATDFPDNPNGSIDALAAISNKAGNVMAMMPHPERCQAGDKIFQSMANYISSQKKIDIQPYHYQGRMIKIQSFKQPKSSFDLVVNLMIEDNAAKSLELALGQNQFKVQVKRSRIWQVCSQVQPNEILGELGETNELFNPSKETIDTKVTSKEFDIQWLIKDKEDLIANKTLNNLTRHFSINYIDSLSSGVLYQIKSLDGKVDQLVSYLLDKHLLFNPYVQDCYDYQ